jgi:hypothetical protein
MRHPKTAIVILYYTDINVSHETVVFVFRAYGKDTYVSNDSGNYDVKIGLHREMEID